MGDRGTMSPTPKKKICSRCKKIKPVNNFHANSRIKSGLNSWCKNCRREYQQSCGKRPDLQQHKLGLKCLYNMTVEQYNQMLAEQNGVCFFCKKPELDRRLSVDHNHKTDKIRSLLCRQCNFLVGHVENNIDLVKQILKYI